MASSATNIKIVPVNVSWQLEEKELIDFTGLTSASLDGKFFNGSTAKDAILNYFWFDLDAGSVDPAPGGRVSVETDIITADVDTDIATKFVAIVDALPGYSASAVGAVVTMARLAVGKVTDTVDVDSNIAITKCQDGRDFALGLLDGDVETSFEESIFDVVSHQTGVTIKAGLRQGNNATITTVLQEVTSSNLQEFYSAAGATGGSLTPGGGTLLHGQGSSRQGDNVLIQSARLVFKPVNATDDLENLTFWRAYPLPGSIVFSGENPQLLTVEWRVFDSENLDTGISLFAFGDQTQATVDA